MSKSAGLPIIMPRNRVKTKETIIIMPETVAEIEESKRKYPMISLKRKDNSEMHENKIIIEQLRRLVEYIEDQIRLSEKAEDRKKHGFRLSSIKKGVEIIEDYPEKILSGRQARQIKGIGKGISDRIDEILSKGMLSELEETFEEAGETNRVITELTSVSGIGIVKARELIQQFELLGVDDLIDRWRAGDIKVGKHELNHHIEVGLRYYYDIKKKIPREEMNIYSRILTDLCKKIDPGLRVMICGSYRRGKMQSNDIDVLLTHPELITENDVIDSKTKYLPILLQSMISESMISDSITDPIKSPTKYMGITNLPNCQTKRRLDIRFVPFESWASGLFYFTGSGQFNKLFRGIALQRGYTINEYGVYKLNDKGEKGEFIPTFSEEQIFEIVGVEYLKPEQREF